MIKSGKDTVPLQVRCLIQIVNADYLIAEDDLSPESLEAKERGQEAASLARDHGLESWLTDSLVVQANMLLKWHHHKEAEAVLDAAITRAKQTGQPRVTAKANFALASLMNQEHQPERVIQPARDAREFYRSHGYLVLAEYSSMLITRAYRDLLQYQQAIDSAKITLDFANGTGIRRMIMQSEETLGSVCEAAELYPQAVEHYSRAISFTNNPDDKYLETLNYVDALWKAGRYQESDAALDSLPRGSTIQTEIINARIASLLSKRQYGKAMSLTESALKSADLAPGDRKELEWEILLARAHLQPGQKPVRQMRTVLLTIHDPGTAGEERSAYWEKKLQLAEAELAVKLFEDARKDALEAGEFFSSLEQQASQLRAIYVAAAAAQHLGENADFESLNKKLVDITSKLQQNWGPAAFHIYVTRPDVQAIVAGTDLHSSVPGGKL